MKTLFFVLSLGLNVLLALFLLGGQNRPAALIVPAGDHLPSVPAVTAPGPAATTWPDLKTEDLPTLVARLRAEGFPPAFIRALVNVQVGEIFSARRKAIDPGDDDAPFWKAAITGSNPQRDEALRQLSKERTQMMRDLLGDDAVAPDAIAAAHERRQFGDLPADKVDRLKQVIDGYNQNRTDLQLRANGTITRDQLQALDAEQNRALAEILSPQQLEDYNLRNSNTANALRSKLLAFDPTEEEFRTAFKLQEAFDQQFGQLSLSNITADSMLLRSEAEKQVAAQITAALGADRGAEYARKTDSSYLQTNQLVSRLALPPETTDQVWTIQHDIQQRFTDLRTDRMLSAADRTQQLAALADETKTRVTAAIGERGFEAYKQYGGSWMQNLQPPHVISRPQPR